MKQIAIHEMIEMPDVNMSVFEEVRRNQLVTEVDIQTQVALDDYQVQLSDIANPTQSQDNVVIDRYGEFLPHWNESLDFDTWVKMSMEIAGKRILMLRGNPGISSTSSGDDVFPYLFDNFSSDRLGTYWNGDTGSFEITGGYLHHTGGGVWHRLNHLVSVLSTDDWVLYSKIKSVASNHRMMSGLSTHTVFETDDSVRGDLNGAATIAWGKYVNGGYTLLGGTWSAAADTYHEQEIKKNGTTFTLFLNDVLKDTETIVEYNTNYTVFQAINNGYCDLIYVRKYTSIEPVVINGAEQNIAITLKLLGRTG